MLDFAVFDSKTPANEGAWLHLRLPTGELAYLDHEEEKPKKPVKIKLLGVKSDAYKKWEQDYNRKVRERFVSSGLQDPVEFLKSQSDEGVIDADDKEKLALVTAEWQNVAVDGKNLKCTFENALKVYTQYNEIYEQCQAYQSNKANFTHSSVKS